MKTFVQPGDVLTLTAPYDVASGAGMLVGLIFAVATAAIASGATGEAKTQGVFTLPKSGTDTFAQGAAVYWDNTAKDVTSTASGNTKIGVATGTVASGDATATVRLNGTF